MRCRSLLFLFALLATLCPGLAAASSADRIAQQAVGAQRTAIPNTIPARARLATDLGEAPADRLLSSITLRFSLSDNQSSALTQLAAAQQNPASPLYRQWLTPEQYGAVFGLSAADLAQVTSWLSGQGLTVTGVTRGQTSVTVSGTVAQVERAFATSLRMVTLEGELHLANLTEPTLPTPLAAVVGSISGLNDFHPRPRVRPQYTSVTSGKHFIAPGDFYTLYDESPLLAAGITGSGLTIAVAGQTDISLADIAAFRSASGLNVNPPKVMLYGTDPGTSTTDLPEASLDVEWSGAVAPAATILYVNSTDAIDGSLANAISNNLAPIVTVSYGDCEAAYGASNIATLNQLFRQANVQGQTIVGPAGDSGATDCDFNVKSASNGLAVDFPASSPFVTALGGTMFNEGTGTYWSTANNSNSGSALSFIPEAVWNETTSGSDLAAGGGGASAVFPKPSWQTGPGVPADSSRDVPDISFSAAANHDGYLICSSGSCTNGYRDASGNLEVVGGTSVSTPSFAGVLALLEQKIQARVSNANPTLYALANSTFYPAIFHDVTTGNNDSPCTAGSTGCPASGVLGFNATAGFDLATGWGSVDTFSLVNDWLLVTPAAITPTGTAASVTTLTSTSTSVTAGTTITLTATVASATSGQTAVPTGSVQLLIDGTATGSAVPLASGTASFSFSTTGLAAGSHVLTAVYGGDSLYLGSKGVFSNLSIVAAGAADFDLSTSASTLTVASGATSPGILLTLTPANGFTGAVTLTASSIPSGLSASTSFSVNPVSLTNAAGTSLFTVIASTSASAQNRSTEQPWRLAGSGLALAGLLLLAFPSRRSRRSHWSAVAVLLVSFAALGLTGCSSSPGSSSATPGVTKAAPGTYTLTVTATGTNAAGASLAHQANITLVVQ